MLKGIGLVAMDLSLTTEQQAVRDLAAEFATREITPFVAEWDRNERIDLGVIRRLGDLGLLGLNIPEEHGGSGGDFFTYSLLMEELGRADSAVRGVVSVSMGLVGKSILAYGTATQKSHWLPTLCAGTTIGCFALTEPNTGSDAGSLQAKAVRDGDSWLISGSKMFITNGTWADLALVFARTGEPGPKGITAFLVPMTATNLVRTEVRGKMGLRGQSTAQLSFDHVKVSDADRIGKEGQGFRIAMSALDKGRVSVAAGCVGIAQASLDAAVQYSTQREQFGAPIASHQLIQQLISDIALDTAAARLLTWQAADLIDRGLPFATEASMAKLYASEAAVRASNKALEVFGGYGFIDEYPVSKYVRDARVMTLYEGTSQIQRLLIGRALTGINAF